MQSVAANAHALRGTADRRSPRRWFAQSNAHRMCSARNNILDKRAVLDAPVQIVPVLNLWACVQPSAIMAGVVKGHVSCSGSPEQSVRLAPSDIGLHSTRRETLRKKMHRHRACLFGPDSSASDEPRASFGNEADATGQIPPAAHDVEHGLGPDRGRVLRCVKRDGPRVASAEAVGLVLSGEPGRGSNAAPKQGSSTGEHVP
jgi:hypothetical protein